MDTLIKNNIKNVKNNMESNETLLEVQNLKKYFSISKGVLKAVDGINFSVKHGETFGLVGESGCGKTTTGNLILRLLEPTEGKVIYKGENILKFNNKKMRTLRKEIQIIFQDPYSSLNPRMSAEDIVGEVLKFHGIAKGDEIRKRVRELFELVGLSTNHLRRYPHEFSGGQRQRIGIARALALNPKLIICDEPVSALDVSIQAQILNLLSDLQKEFGVTYIFIGHGLPAVKYISDRIGVMYLGKLVEIANSELLYRNPLHPYTSALMSAIPVPDPEFKRERIILQGDVPSPVNPPVGCRFHTRCPYAISDCKEKEPELRDIGEGHFVACHLIN